jgi:hypothetical protein
MEVVRRPVTGLDDRLPPFLAEMEGHRREALGAQTAQTKTRTCRWGCHPLTPWVTSTDRRRPDLPNSGRRVIGYLCAVLYVADGCRYRAFRIVMCIVTRAVLAMRRGLMDAAWMQTARNAAK